MSDSKYRTVFVKDDLTNKGFHIKISINGGQLAQNMQTSIEEMEKQGFEVSELSPVINSSSTVGMIILFKKQ